MFNFFKNSNGGSISILGAFILGILLIIILSYFGFDIKSIVESQRVQDNLHYVGGVLENIWNNFLKKPAFFVWDKIVVKLYQEIREGIDFNKIAPKLPEEVPLE